MDRSAIMLHSSARSKIKKKTKKMNHDEDCEMSTCKQRGHAEMSNANFVEHPEP